jgi:3-oxoacyl-[acyl-carrier protein] reductase
MDLGIEDRIAVICASSEGLGRACAFELARAGCTIVINGRDAAKLEATAAEIRGETGATVHAVAADVGTSEGRAAILAAVPQVDILVNNNGGPPFRDFREVDEAAMRAGLEANMVTPAALVRAVVDGMIARKFGRIVNITSASVKQPLAGLDLSGGARAGLTGFLAGVARSVAHANVTINFLLPGTFETKRIQTNFASKAAKSATDIETERAAAIAAIPAKRLGQPEEFGAACAFLCSARAGYITGQSLLIDGGAYPGIL